MHDKKRFEIKYVVGLFLLVRLILLISLPYEGIRGYGDHWNYYSQSRLGTPFFDYWTEFPPLFPFISRLLFVLASEREHTFTYLLFILLSCFQAGNIYLFEILLESLPRRKNQVERVVLYAGILVGIGYGWGYFDPFVNFTILLGMILLLRGKYTLSSVTVAVGTLTKWFPLLLLPAGWKIIREKRKFFRIAALVILSVLFVWGTLFVLSPEMTGASLLSQVEKGSWETIWALMDGNINTGNFGPNIDHLVPDTIHKVRSQSPVISPWVTLMVFAAVGVVIFFNVEISGSEDFINFTGLTMVLFFMWSPGYSPQWMLYFLPFILLLLPFRQSLLMALVWTLLHLLEWPLLLSRGLFSTLYFVVPLRSGLLVLLGILFFQNLSNVKQNTHEVGQ